MVAKPACSRQWSYAGAARTLLTDGQVCAGAGGSGTHQMTKDPECDSPHHAMQAFIICSRHAVLRCFVLFSHPAVGPVAPHLPQAWTMTATSVSATLEGRCCCPETHPPWTCSWG